MSAKLLLPLLLTVLALTPAWAQPQGALRTLYLPDAEDATRVGSRLTASGVQDGRGFFVLTDWLSYNADLAVDAQGGVHLAFYLSDEGHPDDPRGQPAYYTYCPGSGADSSDPSNFSTLIEFSASTQASEVQVVATQDGRPRVLVRRFGSRANDYHFWSCEQDCTQPANWVGLYVLEAAGVELFNADMPQHAFALDGQDRPRFVYSNGFGVGRPSGVFYAYCDAADCTQPGSWQERTIKGELPANTVTSDYATLVFDGTTPHVLTRLNLSGLPVGVNYYTCMGDCSTWSETPLAYPGDRMWANWDLALDTAGRPHVALYEPAPIDITVGGRLFYGWCAGSDCTQEDAWQLTQVADGEGKSVDLALDPSGRMSLVYDAGQRGVLATLWCDAGCMDSTAWQRQVLETSEGLEADFAPAIPFTCEQQQGKAWLDAIPTVSFWQDQLAVAYDVKFVATCFYTDPANPQDPIITRVERIWWAVRVDFFPHGTTSFRKAKGAVR